MTENALMPTYNRFPVDFVRGEGAVLVSAEGRRYLDALSGIAVCGLGHAHPEIAAAVADQAKTLIHTSNLYGVPLQSALAARLASAAGMSNVFFCNSGTEANEAAIKIARRYAHQRRVQNPVILAFDGAFHGRTMGALSATGSARAHAGFDPLLPGFEHVPFGDMRAVKKRIARGDVVAVMVEPIQGENGVVVPRPGFLAALRALTARHEILLVADEVQTGVGRTGKLFACAHEDVVPDVLTIAKALGNGVPIGACLAHNAAAEVLAPGQHGSTFGGNPLAARAGLTVLDVIEREGILENAARMGERLQTGLAARLADCALVTAVRGRGLMVGVALDRPCAELAARALERGLLINVAAGQVIRLLPPLIVNAAQVDEIVSTVADLVEAFAVEQSSQRAAS